MAGRKYPCKTCDGSGKVMRQVRGPDAPTNFQDLCECRACHGTGITSQLPWSVYLNCVVLIVSLLFLMNAGFEIGQQVLSEGINSVAYIWKIKVGIVSLVGLLLPMPSVKLKRPRAQFSVSSVAGLIACSLTWILLNEDRQLALLIGGACLLWGVSCGAWLASDRELEVLIAGSFGTGVIVGIVVFAWWAIQSGLDGRVLLAVLSGLIIIPFISFVVLTILATLLRYLCLRFSPSKKMKHEISGGLFLFGIFVFGPGTGVLSAVYLYQTESISTFLCVLFGISVGVVCIGVSVGLLSDFDL